MAFQAIVIKAPNVHTITTRIASGSADWRWPAANATTQTACCLTIAPSITRHYVATIYKISALTPSVYSNILNLIILTIQTPRYGYVGLLLWAASVRGDFVVPFCTCTFVLIFKKMAPAREANRARYRTQ